jgi:hypothetical protein
VTKYGLPRSPAATARTPRVLANLGWGLRYGLTFATLLSILVVVVNGLHSELSLRGRTFPTVQIVLGYLVAGALAGIVMGALRDQASTRAQRVLGSSVVGVVAYVVVSTAVLGFSDATIVASAIPGAIVGLLAGVALFAKDKA